MLVGLLFSGVASKQRENYDPMTGLPELLDAVANLDRAQALSRLQAFAQGDLPPAEQAVNLAHALEQLGDLAGAQALCERLTAEQPQLAAGWARRSQIALALGQVEDALQWAAMACQTDANCGFSRLCNGIVLRAAGYVTRATTELTAALNLLPDHPVAWSYYGLCLADQFQHEMALNALDNAVRLEPDNPDHGSNRLMTGQYDPAATSAGLIQDAAAFAHRLGEEKRLVSIECDEKIRVGYLSPDLYNHPVGRFFLPILQAHDRKRFHLSIFSDTSQRDALTPAFESASDRFVRTRDLDDEALAQLLADEPVDVLVDLAGHTAGNRLPALARRLAPVQVSWLGYTGSTGLANMDAVVLGALHCTAATAGFFVEPVKTVPGTHFVYQPPDYLPEIAPLASDAVRFCSFNNTAKLNTEVLFCWAEILMRVAGSTLTLKWRSLTDPHFAGWVRARFENLGVAPERVLLEPMSPHPELLARYNSVDIALDPFPFCGGLTTFEALVMGVPVVTLPWERPASRQSAAVLRQLGFDELVASTPAEYVEVAVNLGQDRDRLRNLSSRLRPAVHYHLENHAGTVARGLESIYEELLAAATS